MTGLPYQYKDRLESKRLITRFLTEADIKPWSAFFKDKEAIELFPPSFLKHGEDHSANWITRQIQRYTNEKYGLQALIDKATGEFIGQCGLLLQEVDGIPELEVGYHVIKKHWGKGYAPEAAKVFLDYAFTTLNMPYVISIIDTRNVKSQKVAEKNGLQREKQTVWNGLDVFIYRAYSAE